MTRDPRHVILFEPVRIGPVTAPNRFCAVPHATGHSPRETKAGGGWGVVAMQLAEIDPSSDIPNLPMEQFRDETDIASHPRHMDTGTPVPGPSRQRILKPQNHFRDSHRRAAARARRAGHDIVHVHAAHDAALVRHVLNPVCNRRTDAFGCSLDNRLRLLREVLEDTVDAAAGEIAVAVCIPAHDVKAGSPLTHDNEARAVIPDLWDVSAASWPRDSGTSRFDDEGHQARDTAHVRQVTTRLVVQLVRRGFLDLFGAARSSIADPFLPKKTAEGPIEEIRECIGCTVCVASDAYSVPLMCTQNPSVGQKWRRGWLPEIIPAATRRDSVPVIGSGPAGLECALTLAQAGQEVTLAGRAPGLRGPVRPERALRGLAARGRVAALRRNGALRDRISAVGDCVAPGIRRAAVLSGDAEARRLIGDVPASGHVRRGVPVLFGRDRP